MTSSINQIKQLSLTEANKLLVGYGHTRITRRRFFTFALHGETDRGQGVIVVGPPEAAYMTESFKFVLRAHRLAVQDDESLYLKLMGNPP